MKEEEYIALIYKSIKGEISTEENARLDKHTRLSEDNAILRSDIEDTWLFSQDNSALIDEIDVEQDLQLVSQKLSHSESTSSQTKLTKVVPMSRTFNMRRLAIAASFLFLAVAGLLYTGIGDTHQTSVYASNDKTISIDLADGSNIVLNKNSYLYVPASFSNTNRKVKLEGEAFFGVEASPAHPFEITTGNSIVTVLGTSFNIKTTKENCIVGVISGQVKLEDQNKTNQVLLTKDQVGKHTYGDDRVVKHTVPSGNMTYWKQSNVVFRSATVSSVIDQLMLMYNVDIQLKNDAISECKVSVVSNEITIDKVLEKVFLSLDAQVIPIDNKTFEIKNGNCI